MGKPREPAIIRLEIDGKEKFGPDFKVFYDPEAPLHWTPEAVKARKLWATAHYLALRLKRLIGAHKLDAISDRDIVAIAGVKVANHNRRKARPLFNSAMEKEIKDGLLLTAKLNPRNARHAAQARLDQIQRFRAKAKFLAPDLFENPRKAAGWYRLKVGDYRKVSTHLVFVAKAHADTVEQVRRELGIDYVPYVRDMVYNRDDDSQGFITVINGDRVHWNADRLRGGAELSQERIDSWEERTHDCHSEETFSAYAFFDSDKELWIFDSLKPPKKNKPVKAYPGPNPWD